MPPKEPKDSPTPGGARPSRTSTRRSTPVGTPTSTKPSGQTLSSVQPQASALASTTQQEDTPVNWSEPPLATPKASYKEYDDKASVNTSTQHMLPLGELPKMEATSRQRPSQPAKKRKGGKLVVSTPVPAATTPTAVSSPAAAMEASASPANAGVSVSNVKSTNGTGVVGTVAVGNEGVGGGGAGQGPLTSGGTPTPASVIPAAPVAPVRPVQTSKAKPDVSSTPVVTASSPAAPSLSRSPGINPQTPNSANGARPSTTAPSNVWINGQAPNSKTPQGRHRLEMVVDAAIERSTQIGNLGLGRAIKKLYDESLSNNLLADLLDAVLAQRATPPQVLEFQTYVKNARDPNSKSVEPCSGPPSNGDGNGQPPPPPAPPTPAAPPGTFATQSAPSPQEPAVEAKEANGSTSSSSAMATSVKKDKVEKEKEKKEKTEKRADKKDKRKNGVKRTRGAKDQGNKVGEESESDLSSVPPELFDERAKPESTSASVGSQPESSHSSPAVSFTPMNQPTPRPKGTSERASKKSRKGVPADDEVRTESNVRDPPPPPIVPRGTRATATNPRKRARSLSATSTPPPAGSNSASSNTPSASGAASGSGSGALGTPNMLPTQPLKKKPKGNKIKISPVKKAAAEPIVVTAGIGDLSDNRRVRYGSEEVSENEDVCAVCNGPGRFLCCERCPRSFHFTCLNPPLEEVPEGMWFCNKCTTQHNPPPKPPRGLFVDLIDNINRRNPSSFRLPSEIRNYFVGVETGPLGEYVDVRDNKTQRFGRSGFLEEYDTHRLKDKSGNIILCHSCRKSAADGQRMISCDFCSLNWHLDCVSPMPMPNPPPAQKKWMCPAHADMYQPRRPKKAVIVDAYLRRGMKNNGVIEIENEEEETFEEVLISGVVYRLPERGIKLDFIEKIKNERDYAQKRRRLDTNVLGNGTPVPQTPIANLTSPVPIEGVPGELQATVQSLIELSTKERLNGPLDPNGLGGLVSVLIEKAPADVKALLTEKSLILPNQPLSPAASLDTALTPNTLEIEKRQLQALHELITRRIGVIDGSTLPISPAVPQSHLTIAESS